MLDCKCCKVLTEQNKYLQGLVDRMLKQTCPLPEDSPDKKDEPAEEKLVYGEG